MPIRFPPAVVAGVTLFCLNAAIRAAVPLRPPAVPLVACDPYFSIWSPADRLTDADTTHWTGKPHRLTSQVLIDGKAFRVMGTEPAATPALPQTRLEVWPTRTIYSFAGAGVQLTLTFMTAALPEDIDLLSRPVTYLTYAFQATDGKPHEAAVQFEANGEIAVNEGRQPVVASVTPGGGSQRCASVHRTSRCSQKKATISASTGGYLYVAADSSAATGAVKGDAARADTAPASLTFEPLRVGAQPVYRRLILAYDDEYSIQYRGKNLRPYWRRHGWEASDLLAAAARDYESLQRRCAQFDTELMTDLTRAGGEKYAQICALAVPPVFRRRQVRGRRPRPAAPILEGEPFQRPASAPRTCSIRWPRNSCSSVRRWRSRFSFLS
ncbi:MAG: DUF5127 domain-containing protein [Lacunisphaera sp.]